MDTNWSLDLKVEESSQRPLCWNGQSTFTATSDTIEEMFWWTDMKEDIREFTQSSIHCIFSSIVDRVPRLLLTAQHGDRPDEVVHAGVYIHESSRRENLKYILVEKDDMSSYTWLYSYSSANSEAAWNAQSKWMYYFGLMSWLITDQRSYFKTAMMESLNSEINIQHHSTTAYCPWANDAVERHCWDVP